MQFHNTFPYAIPRLPVMARNICATSHPLAAQAGLQTLARGGNAIDAAISAAAVLTVVEPCSTGLGSDLFAIVWDATGEKSGKRGLHGMNASGYAPAAWSIEYFKNKYGSLITTPPKRGIDSVTIPGGVAGWVALSNKFGKLSFESLFDTAIEIAQRGYLVPHVVQQKWTQALPEFQGIANHLWHKTFLPKGRAPQFAEPINFPTLAKGLQSIATSCGKSFYEGEIAHALVKTSQTLGGTLQLADLSHYQPEWVQPISQNYRGYTVHELPPNGQGIATLMALGILENFDLGKHKPDSVEALHLQIEAMKLAFADTYAHISDPKSMKIGDQSLINSEYLKQRSRLINPLKAQNFQSGNPIKGETVYLTTADEQGNMVSLIQSNYMGFGSGVVEPEFGISLQNRGHAFSLDSKHPNCVAPLKRPFHTIIPGMLTQNNEPIMSFGVMGGNMQPQGHVQTLVRMLDYSQNPQTACDAPRWRFNTGLNLNVENSMNASVTQGLRDLGHQISVIDDSYFDFGAGQFIWRMGHPNVEGYLAASDPRRDGQAVGF